MDEMTVKDVLIASNDFLAKESSNPSVSKLALHCLNKHLRDDDNDGGHVLDKDDVS